MAGAEMKLRRIEVKDFRKLGHVVIDELGDGLNVIVGDNEAGKSTLLAALRAALFERHRVGGAAAAAMQPYNQSVRPEVALEFERSGVIWRLRKAFCQRQEAELSGNGERYTGDVVEDKLAEMFGFTPSSSGGTKPQEHHGVFGLLWVEQGMSHRQLGVGAGRNHLASALEREIGQVTGGERGRALLAAAEARREQFWDKRGNPRGDFKSLAVKIEDDRQLLAELKRQMAEHDERVNRLAGIQNILARYQRDDTLEVSRKRATAAREAFAAVSGLEEAVRAADSAAERAKLRHEAAVARNANRQKLVADLAAELGASEAARSARDEAAAGLARLEAIAAQSAARLDEVAEAERVATARLRAMERALARRQAAQAVERLTGQLKLAEEADETRRKALALVQGATLTVEDVAALEKLERGVEQARMRLEAASVRITLHPSAGQGAHVGGRAVEAELSLSRDTVLVLEGYGEIGIHPGGGTEELARAADQAAQALENALRRLGLADIAAARTALRQQDAARTEVKTHGATVAAVAPSGIEALRQELARNALLAEGGEAEAVEPADIEAARRARIEIEAQLRGAEAEQRDRRGAVEAARRDLAVLNERVSVAEARCTRLREELASARATADDRLLEEETERERQAFQAAVEARDAARAALAGADPEAKQIALKQAEQSEREIEADIRKLDGQKREIEAELRALGKDGLGEKLAMLEGQIVAAEVKLKAMTLEAEAAKLLHSTLADAQRETKDRWLAPVRERSAPYLRLIQADSDIVLHDETFEIEQLVRNGVAEPFGALSVGAREQIAVITRIALADILREAGQEACIVLDDALVNTDEARLERMHLVLGKAAQNQQVLILTCRERDFLQLGAPIRRM
jgi:AAA domain